jgi:hypothetical protein
MAWLAHPQAYSPSHSITLDASALHLLPTEVVSHVHVLAASGLHAILTKCDTTLIVLVNGDGRPGVLVKLMEQLL